MTFRLAIVGRPNVGKSTLFNRLAGKRLALVDDTPGVTRDRREAEGRLVDLDFVLMDTAGLEEGEEGSLARRMMDQTDRAIDEADVVLFLTDGRAGVTPLDRSFAAKLRKVEKPVILCVNKCEGHAAEAGLYDAFSLGFGEPLGLSAEHGEGLAELYTAIVEALTGIGVDPYAEERKHRGRGPVDDGPEEGDLEYEFDDQGPDPDKPLMLAIVGRPNAGKSTLINHMLEDERLITGPEAGLTRDSIGVDWIYDDQPVRLFDTAGLRKRARISDKLEKLSASDTMRAVQFAEVVVLMVDATLGLEKQDLRIAAKVVDEGRGLVIALNKWDLVDDRLAVQREITDTLTRSLPQLKGVPVVTLSALTGQGVQRLMPTILEMHDLWNARISTSEFNRWLEHVLEKHPAPAVSGRRIRIRYGAQIKSRPPTFVLFCNRPEVLPDSYVRYLENELRRDFDLAGVPLRITMRKSDNPYAARGSKRKTKRERSKR